MLEAVGSIGHTRPPYQLFPPESPDDSSRYIDVRLMVMSWRSFFAYADSRSVHYS